MTKQEFTKAIKKHGGTVQYSGKNSNGSKPTAYVKNMDQTKFNKLFGRHFAAAVDFKIECE